MSDRTRALLSAMICVILLCGSLCLAGCGSSSDQSASTTAATQDNCYGDDLPATKN